jgi:hypothetical protein
MARIARQSFVAGFLARDEEGAARLDEAARDRARRLHRESEAGDIRFERARIRAEKAIMNLSVEAYSQTDNKVLEAQQFANPLRLDPLRGVFLAAAPMFSPAWELASAAAAFIGPVSVSAKGLLGLRSPAAVAKAADIRAARDHLRALFDRALSGDGPRPRCAAWVAGEGARLAGNPHAARTVWRELTSEPRYAVFSLPGRPRKIVE